MKVHLSPDQQISDVKKNFECVFPYLKLEFFRKPHIPHESNFRNDILPESTKLVQVSPVLREADIEIVPGQTVSEVEQMFQTEYNLPVQIFRRTRLSWVETTKTDDLTLEKQNNMGKEAYETKSELLSQNPR